MLVAMQRIDGSAISVDPNTVTAVAAMTAAQLVAAGVTEGTRVTISGAPTDLLGSITEVLADLNGGFIGSLGANVLTRTALAAIAAVDRSNGQIVTVRSDGSRWIFDANSAAAADALAANAVTAAMLVLVPTAGTGRWLRADSAFIMRLPFSDALAGASILHTCPTGFAWRMTGMPYWDCISAVAGNAARRLGVSSTNVQADFTAVGDILGGTTGELAASFVTNTQIPGICGDAFTDGDTANTSLAEVQKPLWRAGSDVRYDVIVAGTDVISGVVCIPVSVTRGTGLAPS